MTATFSDHINRKATSTMHEQIIKNEDKYGIIEDPGVVALEVLSGVEIQDMTAKQ